MSGFVKIQRQLPIPAGYCDSNEAARRLGLSPSSLRVYRAQGRALPIPSTTWCGWRTIYRVSDIDEHLRQEAERLRAAADAKLARVSESAS